MSRKSEENYERVYDSIVSVRSLFNPISSLWRAMKGINSCWVSLLVSSIWHQTSIDKFRKQLLQLNIETTKNMHMRYKCFLTWLFSKQMIIWRHWWSTNSRSWSTLQLRRRLVHRSIGKSQTERQVQRFQSHFAM